MNIRLLILAIITLTVWVSASAQRKKTIITADITGFTGKLPVSNHPEWQGDDTLVPTIINYKMSSGHIMGAEYLIFSPLENPINPASDSTAIIRKQIQRTKAKINNNLYIWTFDIDQSRVVSNDSLLNGNYLIHPGDSIHISYRQTTPAFSGRGAVKFQLTYNASMASKKVVLADKRGYPLNLERFLKRNNYLNEQINTVISVLDAGRSTINQFEYDWIKGKMLDQIEYYRHLYFSLAWQAKIQNPNLPYSVEDISKVWDTTMYQPTARWLRSSVVQNMHGIGSTAYIESFHLLEVRRKFNFQQTDSTSNDIIFKKLLYNTLKSNYTGLFRERLLCRFLAEEIIQEAFAPYNWAAKAIIDDYYSISEFPAYKNWMKALEKSKETRYTGVSSAGSAPLFHLTGQVGTDYTLKNTSGKVTILNFWYSGCEPCRKTARALSNLQEKYSNDTNVVFLHVSADADTKKWKKSIQEGIFVPKGGVQLYTEGLGKKHAMVKDFNVTTFPTVRMFNHNGKIIFDRLYPFVNTLSEHQLDAIIGNQLVQFKDGPYVFIENGLAKTYSISNTTVDSIQYITTLISATDNYDRYLKFSLQKQIDTPPGIYPTPSKMLVLSDIEGNFAAFRKLLQANRVIDEHFNWTFGSGHLVFAGDMFDRGDQVTECLWLIYSLEEKARAAGGFVHFILGNHEIMNLSGNGSYIQEKYKKNYSLLGKTLLQVYGEDSELGRWLRTKNIVEKIGRHLFCHGGISAELNNADLTIEAINRLARPHYAANQKDYGNRNVNTIMSSSAGPFWYRGYYKEKSVEHTIDSTLQKFGIDHIITGHTIVADTISTHFKGKIINTDTHHAAGKSEALLIENDHYYRVSFTGNKILLFKKDDRFAIAQPCRK